MRLAILLSIVLLLGSCGGSGTTAVQPEVVLTAGTYTNPLRLTLQDGTAAESCPDPSIIRGRHPEDSYWYLYCTNKRFHDHGRVHLMPIFRSKDLVNWNFVNSVFERMPTWVASNNGMWAPDIQYFNGKYYLYYSVSNTRVGGSAIYVATSDSPTGAWSASVTPVVAPSADPCCAGRLRATIDSFIVAEGDQRYIFYGSFEGGITARKLSADGMTSDAASEVQIATADRYEGAYIVKRDDYFYLMLSAGKCCEGEMSGYGVLVARSRRVLGPYVDKDGHSLMEARVGGTPVLNMNGNRWIGPGHNAVVTDSSGQDWMLYHAVDVNKPYFADSWTRRPVLLDRLEWKGGWPRVRGGAGPSDSPQRAPGASAQTTGSPVIPDGGVGELMELYSDEFTGSGLSAQWSWINAPSSSAYRVANGSLRFDTQTGALYVGRHDGAVLVQGAPSGDFTVEAKLSTNLPLTGHHNFIQGGIVIYKSDSEYVKLVTVAINDTRQIEFGKQLSSAYGSSFLSSPADNTFLRIVRRRLSSGEETYTAWSSQDGIHWEQGATWRHRLGTGVKIGLVSMGGTGFTTSFDYVRVFAR